MSPEMNGADDPRLEAEEIPMATPGMLRGRLLLMQEDALFRMARDGIELSRLALVAGIGAALDALGDGPIEWEPVGGAARLALGEAPAEAELVSRAVFSDDGQTIRLTVYTKTGAAAAVELDPIRAIALAGTLIEAALPRLDRE